MVSGVPVLLFARWLRALTGAVPLLQEHCDALRGTILTLRQGHHEYLTCVAPPGRQR